MNILVCIAHTPETTAKIEFENNNSAFKKDGVSHIMNPYDEWYSLVRALEITEALGGEVHVCTVDASDADSSLRKALAIGASAAFRIDRAPENAKVVAREISSWLSDGAYDLILCGKETIDFNNGEVGGMLAAFCDMPYVALVNGLEVEGTDFICKREIEGGVEMVRVQSPAVIGTTKGIAEQRIPNMRGIMMAKRKPLEVIPASSTDRSSVRYDRFEKKGAKGSIKMVEADNMEELVRLLHEEAKVI